MSLNRSDVALRETLRGYPRVAGFAAGLALRPDVVSINTYNESHADFAVAAMEAAGIRVAKSPADIGETLISAVGVKV